MGQMMTSAFCGQCGGRVSPSTRFCPHCGSPLQQEADAPHPQVPSDETSSTTAPAAPASVDRRPMREELPQANPWAGDTQAQAIAEGLAMIEQLTPGLFDIPEDARRLDNRAAVETVERAVCRRVAGCIPRHRRTADTTVS